MRRYTLEILSLTLMASLLAGGESSLVILIEGRLEYAPYANRGQDNRENVLPDFSHVGYEGGGVRLPDVETVLTLSPVEGDNYPQIQAAIDQMAQTALGSDGFRGAILLRSGLYPISRSLTISHGGIVLRGEGQYRANQGGTELLATARNAYDLVRFAGSSARSTGLATRITDAFVGSGRKTFSVANPSGFAVGDRILITMKPNADWIALLGMAPYGWSPGGYELQYERVISGMEGMEITVEAPLVQPIEQRYGGAEVAVVNAMGRISHCGIENMWIRSAYTSLTDEDHGWSAVRFQHTENCWGRGITAENFGYSCVVLEFANHTTVQDCAMLDPISRITGGRRYSFNINNGSFNLFQRCYARGGRHDAVTGSRVTGPNAFVDIFAEDSHSNSGPHHRHATGTLFDRISLTSNALDVENRKDSGTGHGWAGAQTVFWNCMARSSVCDAPPGQMNFNIGFSGRQKEGTWAPEEPPGIWESPNDPVQSIPSLYQAQLRDRLGEEALNAIVTPGQLTGDIHDLLKQWKGVGPLPTSLEDECDSGPSFFGGCRSTEHSTFLGLLSDVLMANQFHGYIYRYADSSWYWIFMGSSHESVFLWSFTRGSYLWTHHRLYPYFYDYLAAEWKVFPVLPL